MIYLRESVRYIFLKFNFSCFFILIAYTSQSNKRNFINEVIEEEDEEKNNINKENEIKKDNFKANNKINDKVKIIISKNNEEKNIQNDENNNYLNNKNEDNYKNKNKNNLVRNS